MKLPDRLKKIGVLVASGLAALVSASAFAGDQPNVDPCTVLTAGEIAAASGIEVGQPERSDMYAEGDHVCYFELPNGLDTLELRAFPGDPWERIPQLHGNAKKRIIAGAEAMEYQDDRLQYSGIYVRRNGTVVEIAMPSSDTATNTLQAIAEILVNKL